MLVTKGRGVFERSIAALLKLNKAGYGSKEHPELELDLVYNPGKDVTCVAHQTIPSTYIMIILPSINLIKLFTTLHI